MAARLKYYVGERRNPQLPKPYYIPKGQMTKRKARKYENCIYGLLYMHSFDTKEEYESYIDEKRNQGYSVY